MKRSAIRRHSPVRKVNPRRKRTEWLRAYGSKQRVAWVASMPCLVSKGSDYGHLWCGGKMENAHIATGGTGRKADASTIVPLCRWHHSKLHEMGVQTFQGWFGVNLADEAARIEALWQESVRELEQRREDVSGKA